MIGFGLLVEMTLVTSSDLLKRFLGRSCESRGFSVFDRVMVAQRNGGLKRRDVSGVWFCC